jgi:hypothetical protein
MSEETTNSGTVEAPAETEAPTLAEGVETTSGAPPIVDEYQQRVESLLKHHEKKEEHKQEQWDKAAEQQERSYENMSLEEGESWDSIYDSMPESVQRAMGSLRGDYTRKMQALSKQRRELEDLQATLTTSDAFKALQVAAQQAAASGEEFDPFDPKSFQSYVDRMVTQQLQQVLEPLAQQQQKTANERKLNDFMDAHPELRTDENIRSAVRDMLVANESLNLEQAYWIVKGKLSKHQQQQQIQQEQQKKEINRQVAARIGNGRKNGLTAPPNVSEMSGADIYSYLEKQSLAQKK